jgi:Secretion system C-terminal sorting domain
MKKLLLIILLIAYFNSSSKSQCPPNAYAFVSTYAQCPEGCGVLLLGWPEGVIVNVYGGTPLSIITSAIIPGTFGGAGVGDAFVCVPCNVPLLFASAIPGATNGCVINSLGIVPVKISNFSLSSAGSSSFKLKWNTSNDQGGTRYTIQRSYDSRIFSDLTTFIGNNNNSNTYTYTDNSAQQGIVYYRIKIKEVTGNVTYSEIELAKNQPFIDFSIYPNPAEAAFKVNIPVQFLPAKVMMYNSVGKAVYTITTMNATLSINEQLPKGVYAVRIIGNNNATVTQTLIVK